MRIVCLFRDTQKVWETPEKEIVFGRSEEKLPIILDLSPDQRVSRMHGRIWEESGLYWIEDLNSSRGTQVNGVEIKGKGKQQLRPHDAIVAGQTSLRVDFDDSKRLAGQTNYLEHGTFLLPEKCHTESGVAIAKDVDTTAVEPILPPERGGDNSARRFKMVCDLPFHLATKTTLETLLPALIDQLVELFSGAKSWALILHDRETDELVLKAYHYVQRTYLSESLVRRVMAERKALIWKKSSTEDTGENPRRNGMEVGMYAPLLWQGESLGAICTGARDAESEVTDEDVKLLVLFAQYAAMAIASQRLQEKLRHEAIVKANLLRQFSPTVANYLLTHRSRRKVGARRSEVSILHANIRNLVEMAPEPEPNEVAAMASDFLKVLIPAIFANHGTLLRYADGISAIFGSPETDARQVEHAVRAALQMQVAVSKLNESRELGSAPRIHCGIGIHCGEFVHGFIGAFEQLEFTVFGPAVEEAARYCSAAAATEILISPEVYERVRQFVEAEQATIQTAGEGSLKAYRVRGLKENAKVGAASQGG
jgi:adenylate cyclase